MASSTATESSLLSKLESSKSTPIFSLYSDYLRSFSDLKKGDQALLRSLAQKFLSFINKSLTILPKRLSDPNSHPKDQKLLAELFDVYRLCLNCLDVVSSQLSCKPYSIQLQRLRLVRRLEAFSKYEDAEGEGVRVLESLRSMNFEGKSDDAEYAMVFLETVIEMVKCAAIERRKDGEIYRRVLSLVEEARHWFRVLDANAYEKLHRVLVTYLDKCTLFLVGELTDFNGDLVHQFCVATMTEYATSSMTDQIYKFSRRICSSLFSLEEHKPSLMIDMIVSILESFANQCKVEVDNRGMELVEFVSYCSNKCRAAGTVFCGTVAGHLNRIAGNFPEGLTPIDLILRLYATGLHVTNCNLNFSSGDLTSTRCAKDEFEIKVLLDDGGRLQELNALLGFLRSYFSVCCKETRASSSIEHEHSVSHRCVQSDSDHEACMASMQKNREDYMLSYLNALKFICQPLAELVNLKKKEILAENGAASVHQQLCSVQDALHQFLDVFVFLNSYKSQREKDEFDDSKTILSVAVAVFMLSIRSNRKLKKSAHLIKHIIASEWVQPQGLKYLYVSLYNIGVLLYRNKQLKEASKALKLCCRALWTHVVLLCKMFACKSEQLYDDLSEAAVVGLANEACTRSAFLLDVLHQYGSNKLDKVIVESLQHWSVAGTLFRMLPTPLPLVKQWVKIECKLHKNGDVEDGAPTLYSLLSSGKLSEKAIGIILEQELNAYEEMNSLSPELCQRRQMKIISILLQKVYITESSRLWKSRILIRKGGMLRARGTESLTDCIHCLSEAIFIMNDTFGETSGPGTLLCHLLAIAYCLRALCTQEADPNSKQVIEDIGLALNQWMNISFRSEDHECNIISENALLLLYNILDLLSIKGCMEFHRDVYKLMIRLLKWKNFPLEKCLSILWEGRRLSHALCISPVDEAFLMNFANHVGEKSKSIDFWICCLKGSQPLVVGFQQSFLLLFEDSFPHGFYNHGNSVQPYITIDDVKEAASELISRDPLPSHSIFLVGYLYYDLCERLTANGHLFEALSYAKEAHRLRTQLFQEKFSYSIDQQVEKYDEAGDTVQKLTYGPKNLQVTRKAAAEIWSLDAPSWNLEGCYLSPWNVLQCYLESTLQVGVIHELVGNGVEAETFLLWGKNISCLQHLSLFIVAFSCVLGKLYRKKRLWDLAEKELQSAKQVLVERGKNFSCLKCRLMLEATVDQQLGDLSRNLFDGAAGHTTIERLFHAEQLYKSAFDKLNLCEWKNSITFPEEANFKSIYPEKPCVQNVEYGSSNTFVDSDLHQLDTMKIPPRNGSIAKTQGKRCRKTKNAPELLLKDQSLIPEFNSRITRSKYRSSQNQSANGSIEVHEGLSKLAQGNNVSDFSKSNSEREPVLEAKSCFVNTAYEACCICNKMKCWQCLPVEVSESNLLDNFVNMKWEFSRRRMVLRVLTGIGKCLENRDQLHQAHDTILQSVSVLFSRNPFCQTYSSLSPTFLLDLVGKEFPGDVFSVERATILYNICWLSLRGYHSKKTRSSCCEFSQIQLQKIVSWLMTAFVLCREVPLLFQKVSRLLAVMYMLSSSSKHFSLSTSCKALSESHWAYFFHQASLAAHLNYQLLSNINWRCKAQYMDAEAANVTGSSCLGTDPCNLQRIAPESIKDLEQFVKDFFIGLPCTTIICISLLGGTYASLLQDLLLHPSRLRAWMLLSRLSSRSQPLVILLPVNRVLEEASDDGDYTNFGFGKLYEREDSGKRWHCPWGSTIVDDVAPAFKLILEENYISSSTFPLEDTERNRSLWWMQRKNLDHRLGELLGKLEDSWFGPWKYMLLGEWSNCKNLDIVQKKLARDLKSKCKVDVNESLLRVVLGSLKSDFKREENIAPLITKKGCYVGTVGYYDSHGCRTPSKASNGVENLPDLALQLIHEAVKELDLEGEKSAIREPVILVLDCKVQMLPWENLPVLRNQEVYRMPSVSTISAALERIRHQTFPLVDPLDAFYLLNPSGDLRHTQVEFEDWFRDQNLEGKAGSAPTAEELTVALQSHDLYIYFGHGSGAQYISRRHILKLEKCAATLLMGCSSGSLSLNGCYIPHGTPLSYLLAGSPVIVANLWEVTDKDIDRFAKAMLDAWLRERWSISAGCDQCISFVEDHEAKNVRGKGNKKKISRKKVAENLDIDLCRNGCHRRPKLGSFMGKAREACMLPFLIGAAPVCYGVPTGIRRKTTS